jgi:methionyl-tRNA formyltransferase
MGSPAFALPTLYGLLEAYEVVGVVTQPDRPSGRCRGLQAPAVKVAAIEARLPLIQPQMLKDPEALDRLRAWRPDLIVVAAFGQILRTEVLDLPEHGSLNIHASLLPRWRGAAPIQAAILHGDEKTGVTVMRMDAGLDTGPILSQRATKILPDETAGALGERLASLGAALLKETLPDYLSGALTPRPQPDEGVTHAPMLKKAQGELDFSRPAVELARQVRAFSPWPGAFTHWHGNRLNVARATALADTRAGKPGQRTVHGRWPAVAAGSGLLLLEEVQPAGKRLMSGETFLRGARDWSAERPET